MITDALTLRESIATEEFDYLTLRQALSRHKAPRQKIHELLKAGTITRVKKGLYVFSARLNREPICLEVLANQIYGPSCLSLEYALSYYGLIPERVEELTSITPKRNKLFLTPVGRFSYKYLSRAKYSLGIDRIMIDRQHPVLMATPEKALCDYIALSPSIDLTDRKSVHQFLAEDLRLEPEHWSGLNKRALDALAALYRDPRLDELRKAL